MGFPQECGVPVILNLNGKFPQEDQPIPQNLLNITNILSHSTAIERISQADSRFSHRDRFSEMRNVRIQPGALKFNG